MRIANSALWALAGTLLLLLPAALVAQRSTLKVEELKPGSGEVEPHSAGFVHRHSGYVFPRVLGEVPARKSSTYGPANVDVYYTLYGGGNGDGWINLFVYPANTSLSDEVANVDAQIVKNASGRRTAPAAQMGAPPSGTREGWFEGSIQGVEVVTGYRLAQAGDWFIKARVSIPAKADEATLSRLGAALNSIDFEPTNLIQPNSTKDSTTS